MYLGVVGAVSAFPMGRLVVPVGGRILDAYLTVSGRRRILCEFFRVVRHWEPNDSQSPLVIV